MEPPAVAPDDRTNSKPWPILASLSGYRASDFRLDLVAGLTLAAIAIPEQMATARLGGFTPAIGFYAFIAGAIAFALFGASRLLSVGADSTITPIFTGGLVAWAVTGTPEYSALAASLALMVGAILALAGLCRLGWIANLLSQPVHLGFLAGISLHIVGSQLPVLLGLPASSGSLLFRFAAIAADLGRTNVFSAGLGLATFALTLAAEKVSGRIPGALISLVLATAVLLLFGLEQRGVLVLGEVPTLLPRLAVPAMQLASLIHMVPLALVVSMVVMLQSGTTARSIADQSGEAPDLSRDFIGVGAGSLLAGLLGAFPVNASPPRTTILAETGGRSQLAALMAAGLIMLLITFGAGLLAHVPQAALAGILLFIGFRIFRLPSIIAVCRQTREEFALIIITTGAMVLLPIETGVGIGIVLSFLHGTWMTTRARAIEFERVPGTSIWWAPSAKLKGETLPAIAVIAFQAPLSFLNAYSFKAGMLEVIKGHPKPLNLVVLEAQQYHHHRPHRLDHPDRGDPPLPRHRSEFCRIPPGIGAGARGFFAFGIMDLLGEDHFFHSVDEAIRKLAPGSDGRLCDMRKSNDLVVRTYSPFGSDQRVAPHPDDLGDA